MRHLISGLLAACLLAGQTGAALAADSCTHADDALAFDVIGLKSELMVTALTCGSQDRYNAFINKFRADLTVEEKALNQYFTRTYGRGAQKAHDDYITQLANAQSDDGLKSGSALCRRNLSMFDEVQYLHDPNELSDFAAGKAIVQPVAFVDCGMAPAKGPRKSIRVKTRKMASK